MPETKTLVVTEQGLEDAAKRIYVEYYLMNDRLEPQFNRQYFEEWWHDMLSEADRAPWRIAARAALTAAGIQVVDEAVRVNSAGPEDIPVLTMDDESVYTTLHEGDKLYIKRKED